MFLNLEFKKTLSAFTALLVLSFGFCVIAFSKECADGVINGILLCLKVLIPTLFPFMVLSSFVVKSGLSSVIGKPFEKIMKHLFGLNKNFASVMILGMLGGYPVAAKGISALYENGDATEDESKNAALFLVCAGPGFIVNYVGLSLYSDKKIGAILLLSQIISVIILGFLNKITRRKNFCEKTIVAQQKSYNNSFGNSIVNSVYEASKGMFSICSFVVLFSGITGIFNTFIENKFVKNIILCLCEVSTAVNILSKESGIFAVAFAIGFGGLCVHFQIFASLGKIKINTGIFFIYRILSAIISTLLTFIGMKFFIKTKSVFSVASVANAGTYNGSIISGVALTLLMICFLYTIKSTQKN